MMQDEVANLLEKTTSTERMAQSRYSQHIQVCMGTACMALNSEQVKTALEHAVIENGIQKQCQVQRVGCPGLCSLGPMLRVIDKTITSEANEPRETLYQQITPKVAPAIITSLTPAAQPTSALDVHRCEVADTFFKRQVKVVLEHCSHIDPERIEDYIAHGGYRAIQSVLTKWTPQRVIDSITKAGLRGRGGAGYPTGLKWATVAKANSSNGKKYVICNGDEGDPGAYMDRSVMEGDPHRVIEGMMIAAYAIGASQGYVYVRAESPLATKRLRVAIRQAQRAGLLGNNIAGSAFHFDIELRLGAGAFVCGEETALIASIEGGRGQPRPRPPYPAESGLWGCPTLINNVETFANIAPIIDKGWEWYAGIGTAKSKGTKVFALTGQVKTSGLIEVPMGITLREIVFDIAGGIPNNRQFKAVQTGGPSGGCIPEKFLDMPVDYESLAKVGSIMGSGGMIVMDDSTNMIEVARFFMEFCMDESCGKCVPCRVGTVQLHRLLGKFVDKTATPADLIKLEGLCKLVKHTSLCGLGQAAPNPVISTLNYFREEYEQCLKPSP
jgi:bidirectional [NiFe] hydrogenase diaphorase subunit